MPEQPSIPMLFSDGLVRMIPSGDVDAARKSGGQVVRKMKFQDDVTQWIPVDQTGAAWAAGGRAVPLTTEEPPKPSYWEALTNPVGSGGRQQGILGGILQVGGQAIKSMAQPLIHPVDTLSGMAKVAGDAATYGPQAVVQDVVPPVVENFVADKTKGGTPLAVENLAGNVLGTVEGGRVLGEVTRVGGSALSKGAKTIGQKWRPTSSPEIVPTLERSARNLTNAINPSPVEADQFISNVQSQMPEIMDYAKRTKNPLRTRLEFAKAAQGASAEVRDWYIKNLLKPSENEEVSVTGTGYRGRATGEGNTRATIGDIDARLGNINEELRELYRQRNAGVVVSKLASEPELKAEAAGLRQTLNRTMAMNSGLSEDEVSAIRQSYGRLRNIATSTNEAVTQRELGAAKTTEGAMPLSKGGIVSEVSKAARGGSGAISDRMFQRALNDFKDHGTSSFQAIAEKFDNSSRPLKNVANRYPRPSREPASGPSEPPSAKSITTEEQKAFLDKIQERLVGRKQAIAEKAQKKLEAQAAEEARKAANYATRGKRLGNQQQMDMNRLNDQFK